MHIPSSFNVTMGMSNVPSGIMYEQNTCDYENSIFSDSHIPSSSINGMDSDMSDSVEDCTDPESVTLGTVGSHTCPVSAPSESLDQLDVSGTSDTSDMSDPIGESASVGLIAHTNPVDRVHELINQMKIDDNHNDSQGTWIELMERRHSADYPYKQFKCIDHAEVVFERINDRIPGLSHDNEHMKPGLSRFDSIISDSCPGTADEEENTDYGQEFQERLWEFNSKGWYNCS